jgi:hypothetical protein
MSRFRVSRSKDRRKFAKNVRKTKAINVAPVVMKGGTRL